MGYTPTETGGKECNELLGDAASFLRINCKSGYGEIEIVESDRNTISFSSHCCLFRLAHMPLELKNAPAPSQRAVNNTLSGVKWQLALLYRDDISVYLKSVSEHLKCVLAVLALD